MERLLGTVDEDDGGEQQLHHTHEHEHLDEGVDRLQLLADHRASHCPEDACQNIAQPM